MFRIEDIIGQIRHCLRHYDGSVPPEGAQLANDYADAVDKVNSRLETCVDLLRKGLRSEAIHQAELSPNLFDEAVKLDFPEWRDWAALCEQAELRPPARVNDEAVVELDEAMPAELELAGLLKLNRLYAIGRAPLSMRIKVLRQLSQVDMDNPIWGQDVVTLEQQRQKEIHEEARRAEKAGDLQKIESLKREVDAGWVHQPPATLANRVSKAWARVKAATALVQVDGKRHAVEQALASQDYKALSSASDQLDDAIAHLETPDPAAEQLLATARQRLADHQTNRRAESEFQAALRSFQVALDDEQPVANLEKLWAAVAKYDRPVPSVVMQRYKSRLEKASTDRSRNFRLKLVATVGILGIAAAVVAVVLMQLNERRELDRQEAQLKLLVESERWDEAQSFLDSMAQTEPEMYEAPAVMELAKTVTDAIVKENTRIQEFEGLFNKVTGEFDIAEASSQLYSDVESMNKLEELALSQEERTKVAELGRRIDLLNARLQSTIDSQVVDTLDQLRKQFKQINDEFDDGSLSSQMLEEVRGIDASLTKLSNGGLLSKSTAGAVQVLQVNVNSFASKIEKKLQDELARMNLLNNIKKAFNEPTKLAAFYREYHRDYPNDSYAEDFLNCSEIQAAWSAIIAWSDGSMAINDLKPETTTQARAAAEICRNFLKDRREGFLGLEAQRYYDYLRRAEVGLDKDRSHASAESLLNRDILAGKLLSLYVISNDSGNFYFESQKIDNLVQTDTKYLIQSVTSMDNDTGEVTKGGQWYAKSLFGKELSPQPSPQKQFLTKAKDWLSENPTRWEDTHINLLLILMQTKGMDPIYKASIARKLSTLSRTYDAVSLPSLEGWSKLIDTVDLDHPWLDPSRDLSSQREAAEQVLAAMPSREVLNDEFSAQMAGLFSDLERRVPVALVLNRSGPYGDMLDFTTPINKLPLGSHQVMVPDGDGWKLQTLFVLEEVPGEGDKQRVATKGDITGGVPSGSIVFHIVNSDKK